MGTIRHRLENTIYQLLKSFSPFDEPTRLQIVQKIYDAAIDGVENLTGANFPTSCLNIDLSWSTDRFILDLDSGLYEIHDDLTDNIVPLFGDQALPGAFTVNNEFFRINDLIFDINPS